MKLIGLISPNLSEDTLVDVYWDLSPETGYDLASSLMREFPDVDGIYMPCNKWRVISVVDRIEKEFGKPVVTNTQAWVWEALRGMGLTKPTPGYGRLLSKASSPD